MTARSPLTKIGKTKRTGTKITFMPTPRSSKTWTSPSTSWPSACASWPSSTRASRSPSTTSGTDKRDSFHYEGGIVEFVAAPQPQQDRRCTPSRSTSPASATASSVEVALQYNDGYNENIFSFANNINTIEGGTHLSGFESALTRTINTYAEATTCSRT